MATASKGGLSRLTERSTESAGTEEVKTEKADYKIKFTPPSTYQIPDDKRPGDTIDATVQLRIEDDGQFCILTLDGVPMKEEEEVEEEETTEEVETETEETTAPTLAEAARAHRNGGYMM